MQSLSINFCEMDNVQNLRIKNSVETDHGQNLNAEWNIPERSVKES